MDSGTGIWGLLSVADVLASDVPSHVTQDDLQVLPTVDERMLPLLSSGQRRSVAARIHLLICTLKNECNARSNSIEETYRSYSVQLRHSLSALEHIHDRLVGAVESFALAVPSGEERSGAFKTLSLLASIMGGDGAAYCNALIDSIAHVDWDSASSASCIEVLDALESHLSPNDSWSRETSSQLLSAKMTLALRSGRLCAVVRCLLCEAATMNLPEAFHLPSTRRELAMSETNIDSFLIRTGTVSCDVVPLCVQSFITENFLMVVCGGSVTKFEPMGMMGTRLVKRGEYAMQMERDETVIACDGACMLTVRPMARRSGSQLRYIICEFEVGSKRPRRSAIVSLHLDVVVTTNSRCYFSVDQGTLACLLCSETLNISKCRCHVTCVGVSALFSSPETVLSVTTEGSTLVRNPASLCTARALHFVKNTAISLGSVTVKDHFHPFCIELWVYPRNVTDTQTVLSIGDKNVEEVVIEIESSGDGILWKGGSRSPQLGASFTSFISPGKLSFSQRWRHVALIYTGTSWELWLDNNIVSRHPALVLPDPIVDGKCTLGKSFIGFLLEVRVWNTTRTPAELLRDSRRPLTGMEEGLSAYFPLDERRGDLIADYSRSGQHALLDHGLVNWCSITSLPVAPPEEPRFIFDFVPLAHVESAERYFFALSPEYYNIAIFSQGSTMLFFQYDRWTRLLCSQARIELKGKVLLKGIAYNPSKDSTLCWATTKERPMQLRFWDLSGHSIAPLTRGSTFACIWDCGKELLSNTAAYTRRMLSAEKYLVDQSSWTTTVPLLVVDSSSNLIPLLLQLAYKALGEGDKALTHNVCELLHANLFFRCERVATCLRDEVGAPYSRACDLLSELERAEEPTDLRGRLIRLAFLPVASGSGLLQMLCKCFLTEESRTAFMQSVASKPRSPNEEALFACLIDVYSTLQACSDALKNPDRVKLLYNALFVEAIYQVEQCLDSNDVSALQRTSRSLEVFQEILFSKAVGCSDGTSPFVNLGVSYAKLLLRACEKTGDSAVKSLRKKLAVEKQLIHCLEISHIGALLPSLTVSLPFLPTVVLSACASHIRACHETLSALAELMKRKTKWVSNLGIALTFSLCSIGCSLLEAKPDEQDIAIADSKFMGLLHGGQRKPGTDRDVIIKNLQQGVGAASRVFDDLQKSDVTALRVVRDDQLKQLERQLMAAFCALVVPTKALQEPCTANLEPAFRYVQKMRPWVLSKRQECRENVAKVEQRAVFLSRFDICCETELVPVAATAVRGKDATHRKWRKLFQSWKSVRLLQALKLSRVDTDTSRKCNNILEFLQSDIDCEDFERMLAWCTQKARYRVSGLLLLKQMIGEACVSPSLARVVLPVMAKSFCGWHYATGVECCSSEDRFRLHGAFFQLFDAALCAFSREKSAVHQRPWGQLLIALLSSELRRVDFQKIRGEVCRTFRQLWATEEKYSARHQRYYGTIPEMLRRARLSASAASPLLHVSASGLTLKARGGRGTCVVPCLWTATKRTATYYFEIYIIDLLSGGTCSVGVGPSDFSLSRAPGWDPKSYALQSGGTLLSGTVPGRMTGIGFSAGDVVGCGWNVDAKEVYWTRNGRHVLQVEALETQFAPLIGLEGRAILRVNFGESPFVYQSFPSFTQRVTRGNLATDAWDAFRIFSLRAALCLHEACDTTTQSSCENTKELASVVGQCFSTLGAELNSCPKETEAAAYMAGLLSHCSTLARILENVPKDIIAPNAREVARVLETVTTVVLQSAMVAENLHGLLLFTWFNVMNLVPPDQQLPYESGRGDRGCSSGSRTFLFTLIRLAGSLCIGSRENSASVMGRRASATLANCDDMVCWVALALLQRMNGERSSSHAWSDPLHEWMVEVLRKRMDLPKDVLLILAILGGTARLAVPGDDVTVRRSKYLTNTVTLVSYSFTEEICEVVEDHDKYRMIPLRLVDLVVPNGSDHYFPVKGCAHHEEQARCVLAIATRVLDGGPRFNMGADGNSVGLASSLHAHVLPILWRSAVRGVVVLPRMFLSGLCTLLYEIADTHPTSVRHLRVEKITTQAAYISLQRKSFAPAGAGGSPDNTAMVSDDDYNNSDLHRLIPYGLNELDGDRESFFAPSSPNPFYIDDLPMAEVEDEGSRSASDLTEESNMDDVALSDMDLLPFTYRRLGQTDGDSCNEEGNEEAIEFDTAYVYSRLGDDGLGVELFSGIHFNRGCLRIISNRVVGPEYTFDLWIRPNDVTRHQILFVQQIDIHTTQELVARIYNSRVEFGLVNSIPEDGVMSMGDFCSCELGAETRRQWVRLTFVQSTTSWFLYKGAVLQDTKALPDGGGGSLFQGELFIAGAPEDFDSTFVGDMKDIRIYDMALLQSMVDGLRDSEASMSLLVESHLCVLLHAGRQGFGNYSKSPAAILVDAMPEGNVAALESSRLPLQAGEGCLQELDFSCETEEGDLFSLDVSGDASHTERTLGWVRKQDMGMDQLMACYSLCEHQLTCYYCVTLLTEVLYRGELVAASDDIIRLHSSGGLDAVSGECVRRLVRFAVCDDELYSLLESALRAISGRRLSSTNARTATEKNLFAFADAVLRFLLHVAQREQRMRVYESAHPCKAAGDTAHEIHVPGHSYYQFYFDPRCMTSNMLIILSSDRAQANVLTQTSGFALSSYEVHLPRLYLDARVNLSNPQWGYKVCVVYDCRAQLQAMRLFRGTVGAVLEGCGGADDRFPFLLSKDCLEQLGAVVKVNTGKTRRLALCCFTDLFLHAGQPESPLPLLPCIHEVRRMAERQYRKRFVHQTVHSRFVQVVSECYVMYRDALHCWPYMRRTECGADPVISRSVAGERGEFAQRRLDQRAMYKQRDGGERVSIQNLSESHSLHVEWTSERICLLRTDGGRGSAIAGMALNRGRWYFEIRVGSEGDVYIGVLPSGRAIGLPASDILQCHPIALNGRTGVLQGGTEENGQPLMEANLWRLKDYVGVVLDIDARTCSFLINGDISGISFAFDANDIAASAAAGTAEDESIAAYFPFFLLEPGETLFINFGGSHFEYEPPHGCLPLDPINLTLGTPIPYNQVRAFYDLCAHVITGGQHPLPAFCYEEADPFAESKDRTGPAHVSLLPAEGIHTNLLEVKNTGDKFSSVAADCCVRGGRWYYEVTLRTQGLMQIGWATRDSLADGSVGDTTFSWSIDLYRRVKWHNGKPDAVTVQRRWTAGDVIGCALDLVNAEMVFTLNGRPISGGALSSWTFHNLPVGIEYVPAVSIRAGNSVVFNFGSTTLKHKPEGFSALGVSDSWCERMDTFYANENPLLTWERQRVLRLLWLQLRSPDGMSNCLSVLQPYMNVVAVVDAFCVDTGKVFAQIAKENLAELLTQRGVTDPVQLENASKALLVLMAVARVAHSIIPSMQLSTRSPNITTKIFLVIRTIIFSQLRSALVDNMLRETAVRTEHLRVSINRVKARANRQSFKSSVFGQTFSLLGGLHPRMFQNNKRFWSTVFIGEGAEDVGGPYREHISEMCRELMSPALHLFVPTANNTHNTGTYRDAYVPAASATSPNELAAYVFLGKVMGGAMRSGEPLSLYFPPLVWRYLCGYPIEIAHLADVDHLFVHCINEFHRLQGAKGAWEVFDDVFDTEAFVTHLSDNSIKELIPGGAHQKVTFDRFGEYVDALVHVRLHEFDAALGKMREGMLQVVSEMALLLLKPEELETHVCGKADYTVDELRSGAIYEGLTSEDRRVLFLWQALEEATPQQRRLFLRFISGRDRLPVKLRLLPLITQGDADCVLPRAATCFFAMEVPDYSSIEVMKRKLYYSIENCVDMDTDFNVQVTDESEGPQFTIGLDDGRMNDTAHANTDG